MSAYTITRSTLTRRNYLRTFFLKKYSEILLKSVKIYSSLTKFLYGIKVYKVYLTLV